jgi:repressor LexA
MMENFVLIGGQCCHHPGKINAAPMGDTIGDPPRVNRGNGNIDRLAHCGLPASAPDHLDDCGIHSSHHAIIARYTQGRKCDISQLGVGGLFNDCENHDSGIRRIALQRGMDMLSVKQRMLELGINQAQVAKHLRLDASIVSKLLSGKRQLKAHEASKLSQLLGLDELGFTAIRHIPVIGFISAGLWKDAIEHPLYMMPAPSDDTPGRAFGVIVEGDSMDRIVVDGATLIVDPDDMDLVTRGIYAVRNGNGATLVKQFMSDPARLEPLSHNPDHKTIFPGRDRFDVIGRVIWKAERLR